MILLFPDGHLPSPRWRPWAWLCGVAIFGSYLLITVAPVTFADQGHPGVRNPLGIEALRPVIGVVFFFIVLIPISFLGCALSLVQRLRRSHGQERLQLKWLAAAGAAVAFLYLVTIAVSLPYELTTAVMPAWVGVVQELGIYSFLLIPAAVGAAILRHRLYDIDVIINRALVYSALSAILTGAYLIGATLLQELFRPVTGESGLAVATSTLAAAALFRPARAQVQTFIDRRFYRTKYDAAQTVERFSSQLRNEVDARRFDRGVGCGGARHDAAGARVVVVETPATAKRRGVRASPWQCRRPKSGTSAAGDAVVDGVATCGAARRTHLSTRGVKNPTRELPARR